MTKSRKWAVVRDCLRKNRMAALLWVLMAATEAAVFDLYGIVAEPLLYGAALTLFVGLVLLAVQLYGALRDAARRERACAAILTEWNALPEAKTLEQADFGAMICALGQRLRQITEEEAARRQDMMDYYTAWVHQIKTPMAVMKLYLAEDTAEHRAMSAELFRMEQYVDMVLQYLRLDSGTSDLVIQEYRLDELIRETVRKFAAQFVLRRLKLDYTQTEKTVVTDRKWFCCILEQLFSNAIKYTPAGGTVTVAVEGDCLRVSDTGVGIAAEDLPRIFEKGYTGQNGRLERSASGLGLYLARRAAELLHIPVSVESKLGEGTAFTLHLGQGTEVS